MTRALGAVRTIERWNFKESEGARRAAPGLLKSKDPKRDYLSISLPAFESASATP